MNRPNWNFFKTQGLILESFFPFLTTHFLDLIQTLNNWPTVIKAVLLGSSEISMSCFRTKAPKSCTSRVSRASGLLFFVSDCGSRVELSLPRDSDNVSASSWNWITQVDINESIHQWILSKASLGKCVKSVCQREGRCYLLVLLDVVQVGFLSDAQVEERLPLGVQAVSVCLPTISPTVTNRTPNQFLHPAAIYFFFDKVIIVWVLVCNAVKRHAFIAVLAGCLISTSRSPSSCSLLTSLSCANRAFFLNFWKQNRAKESHWINNVTTVPTSIFVHGTTSTTSIFSWGHQLCEGIRAQQKNKPQNDEERVKSNAQKIAKYRK